MSIMKGRLFDFEIMQSPGRLAKAIVSTRDNASHEVAYIQPNGNVVWASEEYMYNAKALNDLLTINGYIRELNGYAA